MISEDADLSAINQVLDPNTDICEVCQRSMISRFGGVVGSYECESCRADFRRLYGSVIEVG